MSDNTEDGWHYIGKVSVFNKFKSGLASDLRNLYVKYIEGEKYYKVDDIHVCFLSESLIRGNRTYNADIGWGYVNINQKDIQ